MATDQSLKASKPVKDGGTSLYPPIQPYHTGYLQVTPLHRVYYELSGNENGLPICFVHGGPGGGTVPAHRRFFNPKAYKIILFDQRGCGKSTPLACIEDNTTWGLVSDMERVREAAKVDQWVLFGGSWGSTLAVAYAQTHPTRVLGMILRGIFMARECELRWLYERDGAAMLYPEAFERYVNGLPEHLRNAPSLMKAYHSILKEETESNERLVAARAWSAWEHALSSFPGGEEASEGGDEETLAFSRIESHYFANGGFFKEGLLEGMQKLKGIRTSIVQGRWDMVCPRKTAFDLGKRLGVEVLVVDAAGHSTFEPGIEQELVKAADRFVQGVNGG